MTGDYTHRIFEWADGGTPNMILDDGGDAHPAGGISAPAPKRTRRWSPSRPNEEEEVLYASILRPTRRSPAGTPASPRTSAACTEETTTGVHRLYEMEKAGRLLWPAINVNDSVTKSEVRQSLRLPRIAVDGIRRGTDVMMSGKVAMVAGFGDVGKGSAASLRQAGCRVMVSEVDPICALQAAMEGYEVVTMEQAAPRADIVVTATGNGRRHHHRACAGDEASRHRLQHRPLRQRESRVAALKNYKWTNVKPQVDEIEFPDGKRIILLSEGRW